MTDGACSAEEVIGAESLAGTQEGNYRIKGLSIRHTPSIHRRDAQEMHLVPMAGTGYASAVRVIARRTLLNFIDSLKGVAGERAVKAAVEAWFHEAQQATWRSSAELKRSYRSASIVSADRVVFNIKGNDYRLVTAIDYRRQIVFIKWIGNHRDYDKIDARSIQYGD